MVEKHQKRQQRDERFDEKYLGLSKAEVALREKMAKRFGRKAQHLDATQSINVSQSEDEERKTPAAALQRPENPSTNF